MGQLREADLAEIARNSMVKAVRRRSDEDKEDAKEDAGTAQAQDKTIRQRYRSGRRDAELKLISSMAQHLSTGRTAKKDEGLNTTASEGPVPLRGNSKF